MIITCNLCRKTVEAPDDMELAHELISNHYKRCRRPEPEQEMVFDRDADECYEDDAGTNNPR